MTVNTKPYLSVVMTSRNDNHGINALERTQLSVNSLLYQAEKFRLNLELIIVEWNPPSDKPRLKDAIKWPSKLKYCQVRIIEVTNYIHKKFRYSERLPLFQMIAKNVGIRRAKGHFVLATNIDIIFGEKLMLFLSKKILLYNCLYRADRYDIKTITDTGISINNLLKYCSNNIIRINLLEGSLNTNKLTRYPIFKTLEARYRNKFYIFLKQFMIINNYIKTFLPFWPPDGSIMDKNIWIDFIRRRKRMLKNIINEFQGLKKKSEIVTFPRLHCNACGDFTLMTKHNWFKLRGYAEFQLHSLHIDSLLLYAAYYAGIKEYDLPYVIQIYHIEHSLGSGWTPGKGGKLWVNRVKKLKVPFLSMKEFYKITDNYCRHGDNVISNETSNWGLANHKLREDRIQ